MRAWLAILASFMAFMPCAQAYKQISLHQVLQLIKAHHPQIAADELRESAREEGIGVARSRFMPQVALEGLVSKGFPGSSGMLGLGGLMASPFRQGPSAGILVEQDIWDFGRTTGAVELAKRERELSHGQSKLSEMELDQEAVDLYYRCSFNAGVQGIWLTLEKDSRLVEAEVKKFVKTGQRSVVERYLSEAQTEEVVTAAADFKKRYEADLREIALLTGSTQDQFRCPALSQAFVETAKQDPTKSDEESPYVVKARTEIEVARSEKNLARSGYMPKIVGLASAGVMEGTQFDVEKKPYAVALGVSIPLFDGLKTSSEVGQAQAKVDQKEKELEAAKLHVDSLNAKYDGLMASAQTRLEHLRHEKSLALGGFRKAKSRYLDLQGTLIDIRESLRNLARTMVAEKQAERDWAEAAALKQIINGHRF